VPPPDVTAENCREYGAVRLFLDRAYEVNPNLRVDPATVAAIGRICRHLDGLPLAVELAAARVATLPIPVLAARLDDRFRLLTGGSRTAEARQKTLRATVDWSHQLLTEPQQVLFRRLSVFRGGWTLEAVEAVVSDDSLSAADVLDLLGALVDRSLVKADTAPETGGATGRYRMLETLREYAAERAHAAGEDGSLAARHATYFTELAETGQDRLRGPAQTEWLALLRDERRNIAAAVQWAHKNVERDANLGLRLVAAMCCFWYFTSNQNGVTDIDAMLAAAAHGSPSARARAVQAKSIVARPGSCIVHPSPVCADAARASLAELDRLAELHAAAYSRSLLAVEGIAGPLDPAPEDLLAAARESFAAADDRWGLALTLFVEMELQFFTGDHKRGRAVFHEALNEFRRLEDHWGISAVQYHLGLALHRAGEHAEALEVYRSALSEGRIGLTNTVQYALASLGHISLLLEDLDGAAAYFASAHAVARELGSDASVLALLGEGHLARLRDQPDRAEERYTTAQGQLVAAETPDWTAIAWNGLGSVAAERGDFAAAHQLHRQALVLVTRHDQPTHPPAATANEGLAIVAAARGQQRKARELLDTAARWRTSHNWPASPLEQRDIERARERVPS
jgi:predicted ATPase/tetratricopeptide (TPR) repeat protein